MPTTGPTSPPCTGPALRSWPGWAAPPVPEFLAQGWSGAPSATLRTLQRAFEQQRLPAERAAWRDGEQARRDSDVYLRRPQGREISGGDWTTSNCRSWCGKKFIRREDMIGQRPVEAEDRAQSGHWEGDLIIGLNRSAFGTLVERTSRFTILMPLPPMGGHGDPEQPWLKDGPPLAGHSAVAVRKAIAAAFAGLPAGLRRSLTRDQGAEMAQHAQFSDDSGLAVDFCEPHSPWQRGTNENTNGLLRQYFPKGTCEQALPTDRDGRCLRLEHEAPEVTRMANVSRNHWQ